MKAIIPAAGKGTRFLPASKAIPKEMLPILDRPVIQHVVEEALGAGAGGVIIVSNDDKPEITAHFSKDLELEKSLTRQGKTALAKAVKHASDLPVSFVQQPQALGLGHAVRCAKYLVRNDSFYVLLGDVLVPDHQLLRRMHDVSEQYEGASVIAVMAVPQEDVSRFGVIDGQLVSGNAKDGSGVWQVNGLVEKPPVEEAPSNLAVFGRYLLTPKVMQILEFTAPGAGGEIQLTDALSELLQSEEMYAIEVAPNEGYDCGTIANWLDTNIRMGLRDPELAQVVKQAVQQ